MTDPTQPSPSEEGDHVEAGTSDAQDVTSPTRRPVPDPVKADLLRQIAVHAEAAQLLEERARRAATRSEAELLLRRAGQHRREADQLRNELSSTESMAPTRGPLGSPDPPSPEPPSPDPQQARAEEWTTHRQQRDEQPTTAGDTSAPPSTPVGVNGSDSGITSRLAGSITVKRQGAETVLCLAGEIDGTVVEAFESTTQGHLPAVDAVDAAAARFLSSVAVRLLLRVREHSAAQGRSAMVRAASPEVFRLLQTAGVWQAFQHPMPPSNT